MEGVVMPEDLTWVVVVASVFMAVMAFSIGANDLANAFGPAVGSGSITVRQACCLAAVFDSAGAILMGGFVSSTIPGKLVSMDMYTDDNGRVLMMIGMTSALLAASSWLVMATKFGLPVSTTHAIVGGVIAFAITSKGYSSANWDKVSLIVASWFVSPAFAGLVSFTLHTLLHHIVFKHQDSARRAKMIAPVCVLVVTTVVALFIMYKGGKGLGLNKTSPEVAIGVSVAIAVLASIISYPVVIWWDRRELKKQQKDPQTTKDQQVESAGDSATHESEIDVEVKGESESDSQSSEVAQTERLFAGFVVIVGCFFALAHGANDVANAVGPFGALLAAFEGPLPKKIEIPIYCYLASAASIVLGIATFGRRVMLTVGKKITTMTPSKAFSADFSATMCALIATRAGIPVSTTHLEVGAVVGVGIASGLTSGKQGDATAGIRNVNWRLLMKVFSSWIFTLPLVGVTAAGFFALLLPTVVDVPLR